MIELIAAHAARAALAVLLAAGLASPAAANELRGEVVAITDGDTLTVLDANLRQHRIRLAGIDAPERRQAFGDRARQALARGAHRRQVVVIWRKVDRYRRIVGTVLVDGRDLNLQQISSGMAWHYRAYRAEQSPEDRIRYADAEREARAERKGLWRDLQPIPPWEWRRRSQTGGRGR